MGFPSKTPKGNKTPKAQPVKVGKTQVGTAPGMAPMHTPPPFGKKKASK